MIPFIRTSLSSQISQKCKAEWWLSGVGQRKKFGEYRASGLQDERGAKDG